MSQLPVSFLLQQRTNKILVLGISGPGYPRGTSSPKRKKLRKAAYSCWENEIGLLRFKLEVLWAFSYKNTITYYFDRVEIIILLVVCLKSILSWLIFV